MRESDTCCLCSQIAGQSSADLIAALLGDSEYVRRVPLESTNFAVVPSLGPLVPGHVLICTKSHFSSFSIVPAEYNRELGIIKREVARVLETEFNAPVHFFEHGGAPNSSRVICTVDHAHLHCVPADLDVQPLLGRASSSWREMRDDWGDLISGPEALEYLYYESPDGPAVVATQQDACGFESQIMRQIFAEALGVSNRWNWRDYPAPEQADSTYYRLKSHYIAASL